MQHSISGNQDSGIHTTNKIYGLKTPYSWEAQAKPGMQQPTVRCTDRSKEQAPSKPLSKRHLTSRKNAVRPNVRSISSSKNSLTLPISEVNSKICPQHNVRIKGVCACEKFFQIFSHDGDLLRAWSFSPGFLGHTLRRLFAIKEVGRQRAKTLPAATPYFRALFLLQKIVEGNELSVQKPELLKLLLKDAVNRYELLIENAEDGQLGDGTQFLQRKPISPFMTTKVLL